MPIGRLSSHSPSGGLKKESLNLCRKEHVFIIVEKFPFSVSTGSHLYCTFAAVPSLLIASRTCRALLADTRH
jgi:hypothetical protein